jgi:hypothetical protein
MRTAALVDGRNVFKMGDGVDEEIVVRASREGNIKEVVHPMNSVDRGLQGEENG